MTNTTSKPSGLNRWAVVGVALVSVAAGLGSALLLWLTGWLVYRWPVVSLTTVAALVLLRVCWRGMVRIEEAHAEIIERREANARWAKQVRELDVTQVRRRVARAAKHGDAA